MITIEHIYDAPVKKVWQALSNKDQMRIWYFNVSDFEPIKDFEFHFESGPTGRLYTHLCKVTDAETEKKVAYTWRYEGYAGKSLVTI